MNNFQLHMPTKILFGEGQIAAISQEIPQGAKVLILYGGGSIMKNGVYAQVKEALTGFDVQEFGGIEANPTYDTLMKAVELIRAEKLDFLLAVGGGSVIDGTKFVAAAVNYKGDPWEILTKGGASVTNALPFGSVLTLPATGSEMNCGSVISRPSIGAKLAFLSPLCFPKFSVLDPTSTYSLPTRQVANGVVDAFVHTIEQYLTYPVNAPIQDRFAEGIFLTLIEEGPKALANPLDYGTRANIMWTATLALNGLIGAGVPQDWATHMLGHELTALHGLDHAQTLAIILPALMTIKQDTKHAKLLQFANRVWGITKGTDEEKIAEAIRKTRDFFEKMGNKTRLSDYDISEESIPKLIAKLKEHGMTALGENQDITLEVSEDILRLAL
ncbi:alcohol dehydrogenase [Thorsellia anophelis]|uniref:NADP-dependent alcohol dehydrogenase n=1 Tax=Thorsellia anophelis DSM 18579 TaxID=1123402 RepID=A0A1I0EAY4_9GAMM|nr:alcohol dehydrogenase [Thorsellia anophelis]SET41535.1 NADP-dependent alcohol dehydrogenase [Thorsellia anophelis DSM 18579]